MPPRIRIGGLGGVWGVGRSASMVMMRLGSFRSALPAHRTGAYRSLGGFVGGLVGGLCPGPGRPQKSSLKARFSIQLHAVEHLHRLPAGCRASSNHSSNIPCSHAPLLAPLIPPCPHVRGANLTTFARLCAQEASSTSILSMPNEGRRLWQVQVRTAPRSGW